MTVDGQCVGAGDAELVFLEAGRDVGMCVCVHVGIDAQADRRPLAEPLPAIASRRSSSATDSTLKHRMPMVERQFHLGDRLADAREDDLPRIGAGRENALEFTRGNDVEAGAATGKDVQHCQVGVGLDRVADERIETGELVLEFVERAFESVPRIHPAGRSEALGEVDQRHRFGVQNAVSGSERAHRPGSAAVLESLAVGRWHGRWQGGCSRGLPVSAAASTLLGATGAKRRGLPAKPAQDIAA
jgi:hypothetical protein